MELLVVDETELEVVDVDSGLELVVDETELEVVDAGIGDVECPALEQASTSFNVSLTIFG